MPEASAIAMMEALEGCTSVLLTGPLEPDGDSFGACLALQRILGARGVSADVTGVATFRYQWLPGAEAFIPDSELTQHYDAVVILDGDRHRLPPNAGVAFGDARIKAIVDHHASTRPKGYTHPWINADATSTTEMIYDVLEAWGHPLDVELAELLYVGAIFDTGGFRYSNTTPATHAMAATLLEIGIDHAAICARVLMERRISGLRLAGAIFANAELHLGGTLAIGVLSRADAARLQCVAGDLEGLVDMLLYTRGVEVAALLVEREGHLVKASLRSRGIVNVAEVAQRLAPTGGGHAKAAGAVIEDALAGARTQTIATVEQALTEHDALATAR